MKKATKIVGLAVAAAVCASTAAVLAACTPGDDGKTYTVTYRDGTTVLDTQKVKEGEKATRWTPTKADYEFINWYVTPTFSHRFDFDAAITKDTDAFSLWSKANQPADIREYHIVGSGTSPVLRKSNWGKVIDNTTKMAKATDKNVYTYTLDLNKGDEFQFAINTDWHNQRGVGYLNETKLADGTEAFSGSSTIGDNSNYRLNIKCEYSGNYTFKLYTHPEDDLYETDHPKYTEEGKEAFNINHCDSITWVRNGDVEDDVDVVTDYYIKGEHITNWKDMYNPATKMTNNNGVYTLEIYLKEGEEFVFTSQNTIGAEVSTGTEYLRSSNLDDAGKALITELASENMKAKASGTYKFTYTAATKVLTATLDAAKTPAPTDYYIDGTFAEGVESWQGYCFNEEFMLKEATAGSGVYEIKNVAMKADSEFIIQAFKAGSTERGEWGTDGYNGLGSYNVFYLYGGGDDFVPVGGNNNNIKCVKAGNYDITFDSYAKMITIVKHAESADSLDIYIKGANIGTQEGWKHNFAEEYRFKISADETKYEYTFTVAEGKPVEFGFEKHPKGETEGYGEFIDSGALGTAGDANAKFVPESGTNFKCSEAGTYKAVYDIATGKVDFYAVTNA